MPGFGWFNPFPLQFGGDETPIEDVYRMLRSAAGKGACGDEDSIEAMWRQSLAYGVGLVSTFPERVGLQVFPRLSSDLLPYYERVMLSFLPPLASDEQRRTEVGARWTAQATFLETDLNASLALIDERLSVVPVDSDVTTVTEWGRWFQDHAGSEPFGFADGRKSTLFANYSTEFVFTVLFDTGGGPLSPDDLLVIHSARRLLAAALPAWVAFQVVTGVGFELDIDPLDFTALSP